MLKMLFKPSLSMLVKLILAGVLSYGVYTETGPFTALTIALMMIVVSINMIKHRLELARRDVLAYVEKFTRMTTDFVPKNR